jgi:hypothetical protein
VSIELPAQLSAAVMSKEEVNIDNDGTMMRYYRDERMVPII